MSQPKAPQKRDSYSNTVDGTDSSSDPEVTATDNESRDEQESPRPWPEEHDGLSYRSDRMRGMSDEEEDESDDATSQESEWNIEL